MMVTGFRNKFGMTNVAFGMTKRAFGRTNVAFGRTKVEVRNDKGARSEGQNMLDLK
jgi:hypothetical protein